MKQVFVFAAMFGLFLVPASAQVAVPMGPAVGGAPTQVAATETRSPRVVRPTARRKARSKRVTKPARPSGGPTVCTMEAKQCPDGSFVSRTGPNCAFARCP